MDQYAIYLRKSRNDAEAEQRGEGETLARHEKALLELANRQKLNIVNIYKEVVSGETIAARPVMQKLLSDVEQGMWNGVLVIEVERLARGDTIDQGIVSQSFKYSNTKIITPTKTYDPNNEFDEEYFEFGLFMSRREYKTINRRLQRGRLSSVKEGKYVGNSPPYGYERVKLEREKGFTLKPIPEQADIVRMIFDWYTSGEVQDGHKKRLGISLIVRRLNELGIKPLRGDSWVPSSIRDMLINPIYIGKIRWNWRPQQKKMINGKVTKQRPRSEDVIIVDGLHKAIIDTDTFDQAQYNMQQNPARPINERNSVKNPLAGLVKCGKCGRGMIRRPYPKGPDTLMCPATHCKNVSSRLEYVEEKILEGLREWLQDYETEIKASKENTDLKMPIIKRQLEENESELMELQKQLNTVYDMLEKGIYTTEQFLERSKNVSERIDIAKKQKESLSKMCVAEQSILHRTVNTIPEVKNVLSVYNTLSDAESKNNLLKKAIKEVIYTKERSGHWKDTDPKDFSIKIRPILPQSESDL